MSTPNQNSMDNLALGFVADRSQQPAHQWWYHADEHGPLLWKERTPKGKRWRRRGPNGETLFQIKDHYDTAQIGPYRFVEHLSGHVIILGGESDVETAQRYGSAKGYEFCCMPISESSSKGRMDPLDHATQITVLYDADHAGRRGCKSMAERILMYRMERGLPPISISYFAAEGESGNDLKDAAMAVPEYERTPAVLAWIVNGIGQATQVVPPPPPDPIDTDGNYPMSPTHSVIADWILREVGGQWDDVMWKDTEVLHINGFSEKDSGRWVGFQGGRWREIDFIRVMASFIKQACAEIDQDLWTLRDRVENGFQECDLSYEELERVGAKISHLKKIKSQFESYYAQELPLRIVKRHVARSPDCFDNKDIVAGEVSGLGDASECIIKDRVKIGMDHPTMVFDVRSGVIREGKKEDMITRGLSVALPADTSVPPEVNVEGLARQDTEAERWIMTYCPKIWEILQQISSYHPDPENWSRVHVDLEMAALLVETAGLCMIGTMQPFFTIMTGERGRNGKGVFAGIIREITEHLSYVEKELLARQQVSGHTERVARMVGKHFIHIDEPDPRIDVERLKQLTSGGEIEASFKGGGQFRFRMNGHILITTNKDIYLGAPTNSILERMTVIPCNAIFTGEKAMYPIRHPDEIYEEVRVEYAHFALLALTLARRAILTLRRAPCTRSQEASVKMITSINPVSQWLSERVEVDKKSQTGHVELHENYKEWCKDLKRKPKTHRLFIKDLKQIVEVLGLDVRIGYRPWKESGTRPRVADGLKLIPPKIGDL